MVFVLCPSCSRPYYHANGMLYQHNQCKKPCRGYFNLFPYDQVRFDGGSREPIISFSNDNIVEYNLGPEYCRPGNYVCLLDEVEAGGHDTAVAVVLVNGTCKHHVALRAQRRSPEFTNLKPSIAALIGDSLQSLQATHLLI